MLAVGETFPSYSLTATVGTENKVLCTVWRRYSMLKPWPRASRAVEEAEVRACSA